MFEIKVFDARLIKNMWDYLEWEWVLPNMVGTEHYNKKLFL